MKKAHWAVYARLDPVLVPKFAQDFAVNFILSWSDHVSAATPGGHQLHMALWATIGVAK